MIDLRGQHVFVAGGGRGIGRATAIMAARAGAAVSVNYVRDAAAASETVATIQTNGGRALAVGADITLEGAAEVAMKQAVAQLGPLSGLVVSAGIFEGEPLDRMSLEFWQRTLSINLTGTFLAVQAAAPHLRQNGGGSMVIIASTAGQRGSDVFSAYATSKGGQLLFMRSMAKELAPDKIRVNCVAPGWTETDMSREALDAQGREAVSQTIPLGRIGLPDDSAAPACFLLSDLAQFITGSTITVDGGFDMRG